MTKSIIPDPEQLDELAAGLDAGWDDEPVQSETLSDAPPASTSQPPHSAPLPASLDALDADWDVAAAAPPAARSAQRHNAVRPSQTRPNPNRAVTPPTPIGALPLRVTKQERRDAERKRRAHEAQQKATNKKARKAERQAEARRAAEQLRAAEQQALAERRARKGTTPQRPKQNTGRAETADVTPTRAKRSQKRVRREIPQARASAPARAAVPNVERTTAVTDRGAKKLIIPLCLAIVFALTFYFALSRTR